MTDPMTTLTLFNAIATAGKTVFGIAQSASNLDTKQQLMDVYDTLMSLKREAADLEDENRNLKDKLRFKSPDFVFASPFYFDKAHPEQPLCPKCFANDKIGPMGDPYNKIGMVWARKCLVCDNSVDVARLPGNAGNLGPFGPDGWMGR